MTNVQTEYRPGLDGVIAAETVLSFLDTVEGRILIKGYDLIELSKEKGYLDIVHLMIEDSLPTDEQRKAVEERLKENYAGPKEVIDVLKLLPKDTDPMDALRTGVSVLGSFDGALDDRSPETNKDRAYRLLGQMPTIVANSYRILNDLEVIDPDESLPYSDNFLYMITGERPSELEADIFDNSLLLYSEHEMPNSTFTARVIASTNSDMYGALTGGVASLKGNLHGGANEAVMHLLVEGKDVDGFVNLLKEKLANRERIMGFGHRVYMKKIDPRAVQMKEALYELCEAKGDFELYEMCVAGEELMAEEKGLFPNLDYYAAPVYWMLNIPIEMYTPIFFSSRTVGLAAHVLEQHANNRLFRPRVKYNGEAYREL